MWERRKDSLSNDPMREKNRDCVLKHRNYTLRQTRFQRKQNLRDNRQILENDIIATTIIYLRAKRRFRLLAKLIMIDPDHMRSGLTPPGSPPNV